MFGSFYIKTLKIIAPEKYLDTELRRELELVIEIQICLLSQGGVLHIRNMLMPLKVDSCSFIAQISGDPEGER